MSGYLEVKYPFKANLGLNPFKSWKRQWCILRPSPTSGGGSLAVYCSEAGATAGTVELPSGCVVKRAKSRSRPHAFAVFSMDEPSKPRVLLAGQTLQETLLWMDKIRDLLNGDKLLGTEKLFKDSYSVSVIATDLSRKCHLAAESVLTLSSTGLSVSRPHKSGTLIEWKYMNDVLLSRDNGDRHRTCTIAVDSGFSEGCGEMKFSSALASELVTTVKQALKVNSSSAKKKLSHSEGDLHSLKSEDSEETRRSSWYSGPSDISLDDTDLIMSKEARRGARGGRRARRQLAALTAFHDSASERLSLVSVSSASSGVYEEIAEPPVTSRDLLDRRDPLEHRDPLKHRDLLDPLECLDPRDEPTYETVAECIYATMRRSGRRTAPPLPPRHPFGTLKLGASWSARAGGADGAGAGGGGGGAAADAGVTRHSSLGSLPRHCAKGLPKSRQPFSVFRKRLKSDSRIATSPKSEAAKENKDVETKKKKFDFTPTRDIFKSFKVSRKMKNLKITQGSLCKGETKSCEFLDETQRAAPGRCSKSVECLEGDDEFLESFEPQSALELARAAEAEAAAALALPGELLRLLVRGRAAAAEPESAYVPMSPLAPLAAPLPPPDHLYTAMSPRAPLA